MLQCSNYDVMECRAPVEGIMNTSSLDIRPKDSNNLAKSNTHLNYELITMNYKMNYKLSQGIVH